MDVNLARQKALNYLDFLDTLRASLPGDEDSDTPPFLRQEVRPLRYGHGFIRRREIFNQEGPVINTWERFSLEDGIELHVRADRLKGLRSSEIKRILERLLNLLKIKKQQ
jgi:hypothetical protein